MADHCAVTIPTDRISCIRLYINTARKSLAAIRAETGADYLLNGTLYDMASFLPVCHLKADGEVLCRPAYSVAGYAWDQGADIAMVTLPDAARKNYLACTPLVVDGKRVETLTYDPGQGGTRGRSALGIKDGRLALYCTRDGGAMARTPEQLRDDLLAGESYYIVETRSLRRILAALEEGGAPVLCAVDEVLRGTNTVERIAASCEILQALAKGGALCLAATHDVELCDLLADEYTLAHFEEAVTESAMTFDYTLRPGKATSRNAIRLLRLLGFGDALADRANRRADAYLATGRWR